MSKLIIIRGPSGAGKSTIAKSLMDQVTKTTALINRDYYMFMFRPDDGAKVPDKELIENNILTCLNHGIDVIFEGNFRAETHKQMLDRLFVAHPEENYIFYLDISLVETLKRHDSRLEKLITKERMEELYAHALPLNYPTEIKVPENSSLQQTINLIQKTAKI
ncbi:MAG: AAA family ATPase [Patescibacteria group bacterium]